jgi:hypothetical protein
MDAQIRKPAAFCLAFLCIAFAPVLSLSAQTSAMDGPPKVLVLNREYLKPGKGGMAHERSEAAFVKAMTDAKQPTHYFALDSMSGPTRSLFLSGYPSFAAWEQDNAMVAKNKTLAGAIDHATVADGDLLSSYDVSVLMLREDMSVNRPSINKARYFELSLYIIRPGKQREWEELVKMYMDGFKKVAPDAHWSTFELVYGTPTPTPGGGAFLVANPMDSLSDTDKGFGDFTKFAAALGPSGMKKLSELTEASVLSTTTNLFAINPRMSYPPEAWVTAEPDFWKPKPAPMPKKAAPATKP